MQNMKYADVMTRPDYDELENSIVDSLSEVSIASNVQLNNHTQEIVNKTISEVVSIYLWSTSGDLFSKPNVNRTIVSAPQMHHHHHHGQHHMKNLKKPTKSFTTEIEIEKPSSQQQQQTKVAWESFDSTNIKQTSGNTNTINLSYGERRNLTENIHKKDDKGFASTTTTAANTNNKIAIPYLDLSYLSEKQNGSGGGKFIDENSIMPKADEHGITTAAAAKKGLPRQKSHEGNMFSVTNKSMEQKPIESKSRIIETNITVKSRNEFQAQTSIKYEIDLLLKELKLARNIDTSEYYNTDSELKLGRPEQEKLMAMAINLKDLLTRLLDKRKLAKRNINVDKMTREEISAEKIDTQKELLSFEERHGRPQTKLEKDLMRPLYDHYRKVKRILSKNTSGISQDSQTGNEDNMIGDDDEVMYANLKDHKHFVNLHSLNLMELNKEKDMALLEKSKLKDTIKKYESEFTKATGRALSKEDREYHKDDFEKYKFLKAKLKLIDALIEKYEINKK